MIDVTASQAQPSAEQACPLRQTRVVDAHPGRRVVRHDRHPRVDDRAAMACVREAPRSTTPQARHDAFDHGAAVATRVGQVHLGRRPYVVQVRLVQAAEDVLRRGRRGEGIDGLRDSPGENPLLVQRLTQGKVIEREVARERMDSRGGARRNPGDGVLHLCQPRAPRT